MDRCALPTSRHDCFKSDNKNETVSVRRCTRGERTARGRKRRFQRTSDFFVQLLPRLRLHVLCPPPLFVPRIPLERGVALPTVAWLRLPTDAANVRQAQVAMETVEKRRPGLFETIIRRSIPPVLVLCIPLAAAPPLAASSICPGE